MLVFLHADKNLTGYTMYDCNSVFANKVNTCTTGFHLHFQKQQKKQISYLDSLRKAGSQIVRKLHKALNGIRNQCAPNTAAMYNFKEKSNPKFVPRQTTADDCSIFFARDQFNVVHRASFKFQAGRHSTNPNKNSL